MVQAWFSHGSGVAHVSPHGINCRWRVTHGLLTCNQPWSRRGSGVVQAWFRCGQGVDRNAQCKHNVLHALCNGGSIMVQVWFTRGSGVVQVRPRCVWAWVGTPAAAIMSSTFRSLVARQWFRRGPGAAEKGIGTQNANVISFTRCSRMVPLLFRCGSCVVQVLFRCGPGGFGRESEYQLRPWRLPRVVQW